MKASFIGLLLAGSALVSAIPQEYSGKLQARELLKRVVSPDGSCGNKEGGNNKGYTCPGGGESCCSQYGWCGSTSAYCGTGCQPEFGTCSGTPTTTKAATTTTKAATTTTKAATTTTKPATTTAPAGTGRPKVGNVPYGQFIYDCTTPGVVALTFDDGPHTYTSKLLDLLKAAGARATFFINGQNWGPAITASDSPAPALLNRMITDGHQIGSHTWSHPDMDTISLSQKQTEMNKLETALISLIGKYPTYMRPPYFNCNQACLTLMGTLGYHVIHTNLDTLDWQYNTPSTNPSAQSIFGNAVNSASPTTKSFIPLMHDVHQTTVDLLVPYALQVIKNKGFKVVPVGECLGDPAANWYRTTL